MHDAGKIVAGLVLFVGVITTPFWYAFARGKPAAMPELARAASSQPCVESTAYMRAHHMELLNDWRDAVVRVDDRIYVATDGKRHPMSLSGTCLGCHSDPEGFCDRCHDYVGIDPYCWNCHQKSRAGK